MASPLPDSGSSVSAALVATELARIEASATFRRSPRHQRLLRYLVTRTLVGDAARLKESVLAVEVFGRDPAGFDPQKDTTVRVEARRLRQKLARFYEREGAACTLAIRLDAGGYVPTFELRPTAAAEGLPSLVVLPFVNLSGDAAIDAWCDALTDEMIDALVQLPGLKVVARTTSFSFKGRHVDVRQIARKVGVQTLLEGSVQARSAAGASWRSSSTARPASICGRTRSRPMRATRSTGSCMRSHARWCAAFRCRPVRC